MSSTIIEQLAAFSDNTEITRLPKNVIEECKRDVLDAIGCALAGIDHPKGRIGINARRSSLKSSSVSATRRSSVRVKSRPPTVPHSPMAS